MNQAVKLASPVRPLFETGENVPSCGTDQQDLRLDRARRALRGLSALTYSEQAPNECLIGRRGDLSDLIDILREELEAGLTGVRPLL